MFDDSCHSSNDWEDDSMTISDDIICHDFDCCSDINPGSGLPMMDCCIDVGGYIYGDGPSIFDD